MVGLVRSGGLVGTRRALAGPTVTAFGIRFPAGLAMRGFDQFVQALESEPGDRPKVATTRTVPAFDVAPARPLVVALFLLLAIIAKTTHGRVGDLKALPTTTFGAGDVRKDVLVVFHLRELIEEFLGFCHGTISHKFRGCQAVNAGTCSPALVAALLGSERRDLVNGVGRQFDDRAGRTLPGHLLNPLPIHTGQDGLAGARPPDTRSVRPSPDGSVPALTGIE